MESNIKDKLAIYQMAYSEYGKLTKLSNKYVYAFIDDKPGVRLLDLVHDCILDTRYNIVYISDYVIILNEPFDIFKQSENKSLIIDINTFEILVENTNRFRVINNLIYEESLTALYNMQLIKESKVYNLKGEYLATLSGYGEISIEAVEDDVHYIMYSGKISKENDEESRTDGTISILKHNDKQLEVVWTSTEYEISNIGYGIYIFFKLGNREAYVYDFLNNKIIN